MSNKRIRKKLNRASPQYAPGGALAYVPQGVQQSPYGATFYGNTLKNLPVGQTALFSPGTPLPTQSGVNPGGLPIQWRYPIAVNTFPPDRSQQQDDIPSFEQLRRLARLDYGINLCERYWLDLVPRMTLKVELKPEAVKGGATEEQYQDEITYFKNFFENPDREHNWHEWIQMALREQSQVDDLYIYKNRTRGGKLLGLRLVAADQMKPLLDDWGYTPAPPRYAYQQYPWGIPGALYTTDQIIHKRETPAVDDPYGMSRVERVILITNIAIRKAKQDLMRFTDGNIPAGFMEVPENANWTPDQIDAYEQSWNALLAGNLQQMVRVKFGQPGMKYTPFMQPNFDSVFDRYILNIRASVYGVPMDELGFTDTSNRSVGESQEAMVYRRTIDPFASIYGSIFTECMATDFEPSLHGELFMVTFGGYEEEEDEQTKAITLTTYTGAGILGLSAAAKLAGLPEDPKSPQIGRMMMTQSGPVWLDDVSTPEMRQAQQQATLAGYQLAANPPTPAEQKPGGDEQPPKPGQESDNPAPKEGQEPDKKETLSRVSEALASIDEQLRLLRARNVTEPAMISQMGECNCEICRGNDGQVVSEKPPYHDGCDCSTVPQVLDRHAPGKHNQKDHGDWAHHGKHGHHSSHHASGTPQQRLSTRASSAATRFAKLANRKLSRHWSAAQQHAAKLAANLFEQLADAIGDSKGEHAEKLMKQIMEQGATMYGKGSTRYQHLQKMLNSFDTRMDTIGIDRALDADAFEEDTWIDDFQEDEDVTRAFTHAESEASGGEDTGRELIAVARGTAHPEHSTHAGGGQDRAQSVSQEYRRWRSRAIEDVKIGRAWRPFESELIPELERSIIAAALPDCQTADEVRALFERVRSNQIEREASPKALASVSGGSPQPNKSAWKLRW